MKNEQDFNESNNEILDLSLLVTCIALGVFSLCTLIYTLIS
jgi:hypothetical protein